jgi:hypothetical protein
MLVEASTIMQIGGPGTDIAADERTVGIGQRDEEERQAQEGQHRGP